MTWGGRTGPQRGGGRERENLQRNKLREIFEYLLFKNEISKKAIRYLYIYTYI